MDPKLSRAVTEVFVRLHDEGLIYRGQRLVNWDPVLQTAISDLEVVSEEEDGFLWHLRYPLADGSGSLSVATTRPETMLGDVAVAVHPEDERYRALIGRKLRLPIAGREIPIVADDFVDREFGSGCVKITPAHDRADYDVGLRHALPMINIFTPTAHLNDTVPVALRGLERTAARQRVLELLAAEGLLEKTEPHRLKVPRGDRTGVVLEPYLTDQWFVRAGPLADPAIDAVEQGRIRFVPENWSKTYFEWMRNIQDWCISRQLWWGHRIPAWYDPQGRIYVGRDEAEARQRHRLPADLPLRQDDDVLDTWFSSALWPFSTMGWPDETPELSKFYPTSVLVTGFDIIFFWVARMAMMGLKFRGDVPFREVYVHGLVRDSEGQKMSKSKGNVIDPLDVIDGIELEALVRKRTTGLMQPQLANNIEKSTRKAFPEGIPASGTDALRFTFASLATQSRDIRFDVKRVEGYRNFCNKLWNAARFVFMSVEDKLDDGPVTDSVANQWIRSRFGAALQACEQGYAEYRFDYVASALYEFTWYEFCDWYLELVKPVINGNDAAAARGVRRTLSAVLDGLLRALHPLMPFITEEIFAKLQAVRGAGTDQLLMSAAWPGATDWPQDVQAEREVRWIQALVLGIRQIRGEMDISPARPLPVLVSGATDEDRQFIELHRTYLARLANLESLREFADGEAAPPSAMALSRRPAAARADGRPDRPQGRARAADPPDRQAGSRARQGARQAQERQFRPQCARRCGHAGARPGGRIRTRRRQPDPATGGSTAADRRGLTGAVAPPRASSHNPARAIATMPRCTQPIRKALDALDTVILGKHGALRLCVACLLARGHLLIEDVPGVGKTTLAHALAKVFGLNWQRVQFTSDMLPADIIGVSIFDRATQQFNFRNGPIFTQLLLADEVNRASPRTQSALLEAMEERQISIDGKTYPLPEPFYVVATQNPKEQLGTYALPESQLDRFLMRVDLGYPEPEYERQLLRSMERRELLATLQPVFALPMSSRCRKR